MALTCEDVRFEGISYTTCTVNPAKDRLELFLNDDTGVPFGEFDVLAQAYEGKSLSFAMNAGMYHEDRSPVGYFLQNGIERSRLLTGASNGNFGLLPNGVLCQRMLLSARLPGFFWSSIGSKCHFMFLHGIPFRWILFCLILLACP